jgi:molybdopterin converting factor subunit 1
MMNHVKVLLFASLKDRVGKKEIDLEIAEGALVRDLKMSLVASIPNLATTMGSVLVSINHEYAQDDEKIPTGAEVAFFPPVSGGNLPTLISKDELDLNRVLKEITLPTTGAACFFTGLVRGITQRDDPHETFYLEYEAYQSMAEAKMNQIVEEIRGRWSSIEGIAIVQRIGRLGPGTPIVIVACTASHRDSGAFEAARYGIDRLKEIVPIWKKEFGPDIEAWVEG